MAEKEENDKKAPSRKKIGQPLLNYELTYTKMKGFVNCVIWSPNGKNIAAVSQDSVVSYLKFDSKLRIDAKDQQRAQTWTGTLPLKLIRFLNEAELVGIGFDNIAMHFKLIDGKLYSFTYLKES